MASPHEVYYRAMCGCWQGELRLSIVDPSRLRRLGWLDWIRARATAALPFVRMRTTVAFDGDVVHTTRMSVLGVPVFRSVERFVLQPDGRSAELHGQVWYPPVPWPMDDLGPGRIQVDEDARGATYTFRTLGGEVAQTTCVEGPDELRIVQDVGGWGRGEVLLRRTQRGSNVNR